MIEVRLGMIVALCLVAAVAQESVADQSTVSHTKPSLECTTVPDLDALIEDRNVLILGELHGTAESPAMIGDIVCNLIAKGHRVSLGLELPRNEQGLLDAFLDSATPESESATSTLHEAKQALLASPFWSYEKPDGRTSIAMLNLLDAVRQLRQLEQPVRVVAFDISFGAPRQQREEEMAQFLTAAITAAPDHLHLVLTGNLHSRIKKGSFFPLAGQIKVRFPRLISLDVAHDGGSAWLCLMGVKGCAMQSVGPRNGGQPRGIYLLEEPDRFGHSGVYQVGPLTGSPPAAQ